MWRNLLKIIQFLKHIIVPYIRHALTPTPASELARSWYWRVPLSKPFWKVNMGVIDGCDQPKLHKGMKLLTTKGAHEVVFHIVTSIPRHITPPHPPHFHITCHAGRRITLPYSFVSTLCYLNYNFSTICHWKPWFHSFILFCLPFSNSLQRLVSTPNYYQQLTMSSRHFWNAMYLLFRFLNYIMFLKVIGK